MEPRTITALCYQYKLQLKSLKVRTEGNTTSNVTKINKNKVMANADNRIRNKRKSRKQLARETIISSGQTRKTRIAKSVTTT